MMRAVQHNPSVVPPRPEDSYETGVRPDLWRSRNRPENCIVRAEAISGMPKTGGTGRERQAHLHLHR